MCQAEPNRSPLPRKPVDEATYANEYVGDSESDDDGQEHHDVLELVHCAVPVLRILKCALTSRNSAAAPFSTPASASELPTSSYADSSNSLLERTPETVSVRERRPNLGQMVEAVTQGMIFDEELSSERRVPVQRNGRCRVELLVRHSPNSRRSFF